MAWPTGLSETMYSPGNAYTAATFAQAIQAGQRNLARTDRACFGFDLLVKLQIFARRL